MLFTGKYFYNDGDNTNVNININVGRDKSVEITEEEIRTR